ncbi:hypothetical protein [Vogesella oryzae]|uniref:hypothetical protein n=1 Tax=Vogesella oryzae TaxID=1735285 RepID=UPI001581DF6F|nr:hypothetical protein [Vogesella oryzae]
MKIAADIRCLKSSSAERHAKSSGHVAATAPHVYRWLLWKKDDNHVPYDRTV